MNATAAIPRITRHANTAGILLALLGAALVLLTACGSSEQSIEERAASLDKKFMCPVCPGETIDQAQVQIAKDMRQVIRDKLAIGEDEGDITEFFVDRYGVEVLASPPTTGFTSLVWIVPPVVLGIAAAALYFILRDMRRGKSAPVITGGRHPIDSLAPYLGAVDREIEEYETRNRQRMSAVRTRERAPGPGSAEAEK